ncbi:hypothetical protein B566_EDAN013023 [Ephemera danica]|nr:hypothetical protein B566_EDAN013023 [Ephemera danica]
MFATGEALALLAVFTTIYLLANKWIFKLRQRSRAQAEEAKENRQNLTDYPEGSQLILVDINGKFESILNEKIDKLPGISLEKFYVTDAADMHEIPDGSVDAVVSQYALCSCDKATSVLAEVKRILAPGGKYYFIEHVVNKNSLWRRMLQKIWGYIFLGCNAAKDTGLMLREAGFSTLNMKECDLYKFNFIFMVSGYGIYGTATK